MAELKARQTPTSVIRRPFEKSLIEATAYDYSRSGRTLQEWQMNLLNDITAINDENLWTHTKVGFSVPRRNGKNEVLVARELNGILRGEKILHTAHRTTTSHASWERLVDILEKMGFAEKRDYKTRKQLGLETIEFLFNEGKIYFRTRSAKGGLGEGFDTLIIDEAQEYTNDQQSALQYVVSDSPNPQTIMCGTPPTMVSSGTVFTKYREDCLKNNPEDCFWAEWSVDDMTDPNSVEAWYETNPSMGFILTERKVRNEDSSDVLDFNIQRLGYWVKHNLKSVISKPEWLRMKVKQIPNLEDKMFIGIKFSHNSDNVAMSIAFNTTDERVFVESIDCKSSKNGLDWICEFIARAPSVSKIVVDGAKSELLVRLMKDYGIKHKPHVPSTREVVDANVVFEDSVNQERLCHMNQPSLTQIVSNCDKRQIGTNGGFGYKALKPDLEIALMDSVILAQWAALTLKPKRVQRNSY